MRIGVFGGSFDPVHAGHLAAAREVADRLGLDQVRFVPAARQPFKEAHHAPAAARAEMLDLAVTADRRFVVDRRELQREGTSYMVETLRSLREDFPRDQLFLLVGADAAQDLPAWREAAALPGLADIVVHTRPGAAVPALPWPAQRLDVTVPDVTATAVREAVGAGRPIDGVVPPAVAVYIREHRLYQTEGQC